MADELNKICLNQIFIIQEGYSFTDKEGRPRATGSITLVKTRTHIILVDTGSPREKDKLIDSLTSLKVNPQEIDYVVCTHGHVDHVGNLNLFPKAIHIVGNDICHKDDIYSENKLKDGDNFVIEESEVIVVPTVGHTAEDISVLVYNTQYGTVAIVGDLFECQDDEGYWKECSQFIEKQKVNRIKMTQLADFIVPGHGPMFPTSMSTKWQQK